MPRVRAKAPSGLVEVKRLRAFHAGALRLIRSLRVMDSGTLRLVGSFIAPLSVSVAPETVSGRATSGLATTNTATATPSGGQAPYSYAWSLVSNSGLGTPVPTNSTGATTAFRGSVNSEAVFRVTVTDALGSQAEATVYASFQSYA